MIDADLQLRPVGVVASSLTAVGDAPNQGDEGAPDADLVFDPTLAVALGGMAVDDEIVVLTWLHQSDRDVLVVHPRDDDHRPLTGVFSTRSPHRPNPIGLHEVVVIGIESTSNEVRVRVRGLEAIDGTPILDVKPVLAPITFR